MTHHDNVVSRASHGVYFKKIPLILKYYTSSIFSRLIMVTRGDDQHGFR
jgi:hypothetical protein